MKNIAALGLVLLSLAVPFAWSQTAAGKVEMKTYTSTVKNSPVTVVHYGAPWCGPCVAMEPAVEQFEQAYKSKVNLVMINVDDRKSPEMQKYGEFVQKAGGIPYTVWLDAKGKVLGEKVGGMTAQELSSATDGYVKRAK